MSLVGSEIPVYEFFAENPPAIVGELSSGLSVTIEVWRNGHLVSLESNVCREIGTTGKYSWSTGNLGAMPASRTQYHFRMTGGSETDDGDFVLLTHENTDGKMPRDLSSYVMRLN